MFGKIRDRWGIYLRRWLHDVCGRQLHKEVFIMYNPFWVKDYRSWNWLHGKWISFELGLGQIFHIHYDDVIMTTMASQITSLTVVYSTVYSDVDQRIHQSSASLAFVWGIHRDRWIPRTKGQLRGKCFHLMTSSWISLSHFCTYAI